MATIEKRTGRDGITYRVKVRRQGCEETATFGTKQEAMAWDVSCPSLIAIDRGYGDRGGEFVE